MTAHSQHARVTSWKQDVCLGHRCLKHCILPKKYLCYTAARGGPSSEEGGGDKHHDVLRGK